MATATTPTSLVSKAEGALAAARAASAFLAAHPDLPLARMHANGPGHRSQTDGPLLEIQLDDNVTALREFAALIAAVVEDPTENEFRVTVELDGVTVWVTAWTYDEDEDDDF